MKFKKTLAALTAATMTLSSAAFAPATCFADDAAADFQKLATANLEKKLENFSKQYDFALNRADALAKDGEHADVSLKLGEAGSTLLSLLGIDTSWFKDLSFSIDEKMSEDTISMVMHLCLNDKSLLTINMPLDPKTSMVYIQIPELFAEYLAVPAKSTNENVSPEASLYFATHMKESLPAGDLVSSLVNRYATLLIENISNVTASTETLFEGDFAQECTVYTVNLTYQNLFDMVQSVLTTAKDDADLKELITNTADALPISKEGSGEEIYAAFQETVQGLLNDMSTDADIDNPDDVLVSLEIGVDADNNVASMTVIAADEPVFYLENSKNGDVTHTDVEFSADETAIYLIGDTTKTDDISNGEYQLIINADGADIPVLDFTATDCYSNVETFEARGTYSVKVNPDFLQTITSEQDDPSISMIAAMVSSYELVLSQNTNEDGGTVGIAVRNGDNDLFLIEESVKYGVAEEVAIPGASDAVVNMADEEAVNEFASKIDISKISGMLIDAGVPEELVAQIMGSTVGE